MREQQIRSTIHCEVIMQIALMSINLPFNIIKSVFKNRQVKKRNYSTNKKEVALEIQLNHAHIACLFDEDHTCDVVFIFLDHPADMIHYHTYCTTKYPFDESVNGWVYNNRCIQIHTECEQFNLLIIPISLAKQLHGTSIP